MRSSGFDRFALLATIVFAFILWSLAFFFPWGSFWIKISLSAASLAALGIYFQKGSNDSFVFDTRAILIGLVSAALLYLIFWAGKVVATGLFPFAEHQIGSIYGKGAGASRWMIALLLLFVTGPCEEIYWRGYLQRKLMQCLGGWQGWLLASAIYAGVHIWSFNFMLIGAAAVAGAFWGALYWRLGRLPALIVSHSLWSAFIFAVLPVP